MDTGLRLLPFEKPSFEKIRDQSDTSPISSQMSFEDRLPSLASEKSKKSEKKSELGDEPFDELLNASLARVNNYFYFNFFML